MKDDTYEPHDLSRDELRETLIAREERRRRAEAAHWRRFVPDYPPAFSDDEQRMLRASPDPLAIVLYGMIFERMDEWRHPHDLLDMRQVSGRFRAAGLRFANRTERHVRTEAALAYLLDAGLIVPGIDCGPFKLGAKWWLDRIWREWELAPAEIEKKIRLWRRRQLNAIVEPRNWRWQTYEPSPAIRRDYEAAGPMVWRLLRRLPAYAHLPEQHPPRGETYAEAERRYRQERAHAC